ncbi:unnamed protein product [marine sediment metagenome]|uniref:Uncharacterized protein n=1 Tax=marine sediment metagenome TaxID=412755 RepID=X1GSS1_9ZZZZ
MSILKWVILVAGLIGLIWYELWVKVVIKKTKGGSAKNPSQIISTIQYGNGIILAFLLAGAFYVFNRIDQIVNILNSIKELRN